MRVLNNNDYKLFERLVSLSQKELKRAMGQYLREKYKNLIITKDYIVAIGDIPIALVAHMDTVFTTPAFDLYYDRQKGVLWSPNGLGADDRAGIFAILKIIQSGYRPSIILTTDEEKGGVGACALAQDYEECPIPNLKYMIELDRRGINDCVFYDCYCPEFVEYVSSFGFVKRQGSFSDISFLMSAWDICGVNLSVGYDNEHSRIEILDVNPLFNTIKKVKRMLQETNIPNFKYDEIVSEYSNWWKAESICGQHCDKCKKPYSEYELFPVKGLNGDMKLYCPNCIAEVGWCDECQNAYEIEDRKHDKNICKECKNKQCMKK